MAMNSPSSSELSSDLSSIGSLSPPPDYPTPPSSQEPLPTLGEKRQNPTENDESPPVKKQRTAEPKPRVTRHLNLGSSPHNLATEQKVQLETLLKVLRKRRKILVVAGAGISVSAGIPDFRSDKGLFKTLREDHKLKASGKHLFDASVYQTDASTSSFHDMVRGLSEQATAAEPTEFHHMLARLASEGRLMRLYTQNVDGIETSMPPLGTRVPLGDKGPWPRTVQLHGGLEKMVCIKCHSISDFEPVLFNGAKAPFCNFCVETDKIRTDHAGKRSHGIGRLRPRIVLYNEHNPDQDAIGRVMEADLKARPDAVIVVGTSMKIPGVKRFVREACNTVRDRKDGLTIWINRDSPPVGKEFENCWDLVVEGDCDQVATRAHMKRWDDTSEDYQECTESDAERAAKSSEVQVVVESQVKKVVKSALLTPAPSPRSKSAELENRKKVNLKLKPPKPLDLSKLQSIPKEKSIAALSTMTKASKPRPKAPAVKPSKPKKGSRASLPNPTINNVFKVSKPQAPRFGKPKLVYLSDDELSPRAMAPISPSSAWSNGPIHRESSIKAVFPNLPPNPHSSQSPAIENIHFPVTQNSPASTRKALNPNFQIGYQHPRKVSPKVVIQTFRVPVGEYLRRQSEEPYSTPLIQASQLNGRQIERAKGRLKRLSEEIVSPTSMPEGMKRLLH